ncbi:MAG: transporter associated domain-containing protein, partial [candidate division NC10 bacterium]
AEKKPIVLTEILRPVFFAPETAQVSHLLKEMQKRRMPMALVVDEYGGVKGLVTIEDLIEEIVGEIQDEADREHRPVERLRDGSYLVDASVSIGDLAEQHHLPFPESAEYETLAGFLLSQLERIPRGGEVVTYQDWRLTIVDMDARRIARVKVERRGRSEGPPRPKEATRDAR